MNNTSLFRYFEGQGRAWLLRYVAAYKRGDNEAVSQMQREDPTLAEHVRVFLRDAAELFEAADEGAKQDLRRRLKADATTTQAVLNARLALVCLGLESGLSDVAEKLDDPAKAPR